MNAIIDRISSPKPHIIHLLWSKCHHTLRKHIKVKMGIAFPLPHR